MPSDILITILAYGHILSAIAWLGSGLLTGFILGPNLRKMSPAAGLEFNAKVLPKILGFIRSAVISTFVFGLLLLYFFRDGDFSWLSGSTQGYVLSFGILLALVAGGLAFGVVVPSFNKVVKISNEVVQSGKMPPPPELMASAKRARVASTIAVVILFVVLALMVSSGFLFGFV